MPNDGATASSPSEQEVRQMKEKYRTVILQRDITTLEKIWADDYVFVNAAGNVLAKTERLANTKSGATTLDSIQREENITVRVYQNSAEATSRVGQSSRCAPLFLYFSTILLRATEIGLRVAGPENALSSSLEK